MNITLELSQVNVELVKMNIVDVHLLHAMQQKAFQQVKRNCNLYEKMGYRRTDFERQINSRMTLIGYKKQGALAILHEK